MLHSVQVGGRREAYELKNQDNDRYVFESVAITQDPKAIRSQRVIIQLGDRLHYELNMATHAAKFQNHLKADLIKKGRILHMW